MENSLHKASDTVTALPGSKTWDALAKLDPFWVVLHHPEKKYGRWGSEEFFSTGEAEVSSLLERCCELGIPPRHGRALDFGCGVGRLTRALGSRFSQCLGIDISSEMVSLARKFNEEFSNCEFVMSCSHRLPFPDESFDFVSAFIVLQHIRAEWEILNWIVEFARVLSPGGAVVFQLPDKPSLRRRIQGRRRLWSLLHFLGVGERSLYEMFGLTPIRMNGVPPGRVRGVMENAGVQVVKVEEDSMAGPNYRSYTYFGLKKEMS